jgi:outer membrane receptor protein involved in Fe transport
MQSRFSSEYRRSRCCRVSPARRRSCERGARRTTHSGHADAVGGCVLRRAAYNVVGIYADDRPNEDTIIGFGIDNLFDQYDVRYLDLRTLSTQLGSNNLVRSPSPGITFK